MDVLFLHGAGGWEDDQPLAGELGARLDVPVTMPRFPDEDMSAAGWLRGITDAWAWLGAEAVVVGHSFGASMALLQLADGWQGPLPRGLILLATPFWGEEGWQGEYALPADFDTPSGLPIVFHHCADDETVPVGHLDRFGVLLPDAVVRRHETGGHQFEGRMAAVADDVARLST